MHVLTDASTRLASRQTQIEEQTMPANAHLAERDKVSGSRQIVSKAFSMDLPPSDDDDELAS